jgi:hypothetical protein
MDFGQNTFTASLEMSCRRLETGGKAPFVEQIYSAEKQLLFDGFSQATASDLKRILLRPSPI